MKCLILSDSLALHTGFAQVVRQMVTELRARHHQVAQVTTGDGAPYFDRTQFNIYSVTPYFPHTTDDHWGFTALPVALRDFDPDVCLIICDSGSARLWQAHLRKLAPLLPVLLYAPVEGSPIHPGYAAAFRDADAAFTMTKWGAEKVSEQYPELEGIEWVHHGVDHDLFHTAPEAIRAHLRHDLGWQDKFIVGYVARNQGRKAHDRLIRAMGMLKDRAESSDVHLYLHCASFENNWNGGWDLRLLAEQYGVADRVIFRDDIAPKPRPGRRLDGQNGVAPRSLAHLYHAMDLYVHPAKVEGFGLPILEAMASGLPVVLPNDEGNMREVGGDIGGAAIAYMQPDDLEVAPSGAIWVNVNPQTIAYTIETVRHNSELLKIAGERAAAHARTFSWTPMRDRLSDALEELTERGATPSVGPWHEGEPDADAEPSSAPEALVTAEPV